MTVTRSAPALYDRPRPLPQHPTTPLGRALGVVTLPLLSRDLLLLILYVCVPIRPPTASTHRRHLPDAPRGRGPRRTDPIHSVHHPQAPAARRLLCGSLCVRVPMYFVIHTQYPHCTHKQHLLDVSRDRGPHPTMPLLTINRMQAPASLSTFFVEVCVSLVPVISFIRISMKE